MTSLARKADILIRLYCSVAAAIVFGMIQKAAKGDTSAAKFLKEINGEGSDQTEDTTAGLQSLSAAVVCRLAGFTPEMLNRGK